MDRLRFRRWLNFRSSLREALISYWRLDEASGIRYDLTPSSNGLVSTNGVGAAAGVLGGAAAFARASSQHLEATHDASQQVPDPISFTFAGWAYFDSSGTFQVVVSKCTPAGQAGGVLCEYALYRWTDNFLYFDVGNGTALGEVGSAAAVSAGAWHHVIAWHDADRHTLSLQLDGGAVQAAAWAGGTRTDVGKLRLGWDGAAGRYLDGRLDGWGFWKRVLTPTERGRLAAGLDFPF